MVLGQLFNYRIVLSGISACDGGGSGCGGGGGCLGTLLYLPLLGFTILFAICCLKIETPSDKNYIIPFAI